MTGRTRGADYATLDSSMPQFPPPEAPASRASSTKKTQRNHEKLLRRHRSAAFKRATALFAEQEGKTPGERLSMEKVRDIVGNEYGKGISPTIRLIQRNVKTGIVGVSLVKPAVRSKIICNQCFKLNFGS